MTGCRWLVIPLTLMLYACGGGGGSPADTSVVEGAENQSANPSDQSNGGVVDDAPEQTNNSDPVDSGSDDTETTDSSESDSGNDSDTNEEADPGGSTGSDDEVSDNSGAVLQANIVAAELGPAPGLPGKTLRSIEQVAIIPSGTLAFSATDAARVHTVWHGTVTDPLVLFKDGDPIASDVQLPFQEALAMELADNGSLGLIVSADTRQQNNQTDDTAFVVSKDGTVEIILKSGQSVPGPINESFVVGSVESIRHSNAGSLIVVKPQDRTHRSLLLVSRSGTLEQFSALSSYSYQAVGYLLPNGCRFSVSNSTSSDLRVGRNFDIANDGTLVFIANLFSGGEGTTCEGSSLVRRIGDQYEIVVTEGQAVPGAPGSTFSSLDIHSVLADGSAVVLAQTVTATGELFGERRWSWWLFPKSGEAALIVLAGEEFEIGASTAVLPENFGYSRWPGNRLRVNNGQAAFRLDNVPVPDAVLQDLKADIIYAGAIRTGQPHAELLAPGASALQPTVISGASSYPAFSDGSYFSAISDPVAAPGNQWLYAGNYVNAAVGGEGRSGIWRVSVGSEPSEIVAVGQKVVLSGLERELTSVYSQYSNVYRSAAPLVALSDGSIVFLGSIDRSSDALVHVIPASESP